MFLFKFLFISLTLEFMPNLLKNVKVYLYKSIFLRLYGLTISSKMINSFLFNNSVISSFFLEEIEWGVKLYLIFCLIFISLSLFFKVDILFEIIIVL